MAAPESSGGGPRRSSPDKRLAESLLLSFHIRQCTGNRLPLRTKEGRLRLPAIANLCQDGGRGDGLATLYPTKMAAGGFRDALPQSSSRCQSRGSRRQSERGGRGRGPMNVIG
ncbi:uncharacterized protein LOC129397822 [Pan paniscus]|uniref:uncharacterized protein LOC128966704 n=1 Tax=Homo sapiens TaxID=9606 RepID=UPI0023DE6C96|nr:uncharacterized protein LOC128966704 [Homo sapiens]XP_054209936.1 uncharacterized protein LOC128966704 [Homo sapiens]XP_054968714.1 uncharacterized protein LOC129397822 [Pan paniscus]